ncbi:Wash Complex Subunit 2C [Manis pentadactyla]|nr:Wash Complex Subunit 2C [Manis pentadactyla]
MKPSQSMEYAVLQTILTQLSGSSCMRISSYFWCTQVLSLPLCWYLPGVQPLQSPCITPLLQAPKEFNLLDNKQYCYKTLKTRGQNSLSRSLYLCCELSLFPGLSCLPSPRAREGQAPSSLFQTARPHPARKQNTSLFQARCLRSRHQWNCEKTLLLRAEAGSS